MKRQQVLSCMFSCWYPRFKELTFESKVIPIPQEVVDYLLSDGLVLPLGCEDSTTYTSNTENFESEGVSDWPEDEQEDSDELPVPCFPEFQEALTVGIQELGGEVFPKLNWSSPQDASWISFNNTIKCTCPREVFLLLKSSDFISHDLTQPFNHCDEIAGDEGSGKGGVDYTLVLRKWQEVNPAGEFRCFVHNDNLFAMCQRHPSRHFPHITTDKESIMEDIVNFFNMKIQHKFTDSSYVFDVYRFGREEVALIDFNPFGRSTDSLMFEWEELEGEHLHTLVEAAGLSQLPELRYVQTDSGVTPDPFQCFKVPQDFVHLTTGEDPTKLLDLINLKIQSQRDSDEATSSDDEQAQQEKG